MFRHLPAAALPRLLAPALFVAVLGLATGCEEQGPMEATGEEIDDSLERAADEAEEAMDEIEEGTD